MATKVFLSHAIADRPIVEQVAEDLVRSGIHVVREGERESGADWGNRMRELLGQSDALVVLLPTQQKGQDYLMAYVGAARALDKPVVAIRRKHSRIPDPLRNHRTIALDHPSAAEIASTIRQSVAA